MSRRALFLDRDGVLNALVRYRSSGEHESPRVPEDLEILEGAREALQAASAGGWMIFVISNQPSFVKGKTSLEALQAVHARLVGELGPAAVDEYFYCFHHPDFSGPCQCRKPNPSLVLEAARRHDIDLARSWFVGDQDTDIECGLRAGCRTALLEYPETKPKRGRREPHLVASDLADFVRRLARQDGADDSPTHD